MVGKLSPQLSKGNLPTLRDLHVCLFEYLIKKEDLPHTQGEQPMKQPLYILIALGLLLAVAQADTAEVTATIAFNGTSTLHDFGGSVTSSPFTVTLHQDPATGNVRVSAAAEVVVKQMTTDHKKRDKNMMKMLDPETFSLISGTLSEAELPMVGSSTATLQLKIGPVERKVEASLSNYERKGNQVSCRMTFPVSLKAFELKRPSVLGIIRVGDTVHIECTLKGTVK
jgi:hypothetical protein